MKFKTLKGKEVNINIFPSSYARTMPDEAKCSSGQYSLGNLISEIYGSNIVLLENFNIPDSKLSLDFYLPHYNLAFEYQGIQHDKFSKFFHGDQNGFKKQIKRDESKRTWCDLNNIVLVEVRGELDNSELMLLIENSRKQDGK